MAWTPWPSMSLSSSSYSYAHTPTRSTMQKICAITVTTIRASQRRRQLAHTRQNHTTRMVYVKTVILLSTISKESKSNKRNEMPSLEWVNHKLNHQLSDKIQKLRNLKIKRKRMEMMNIFQSTKNHKEVAMKIRPKPQLPQRCQKSNRIHGHDRFDSQTQDWKSLKLIDRGTSSIRIWISWLVFLVYY